MILEKINLNPYNRPFCILSIDGGGIRGVIPLNILQEIEKKTGKSISELFDLVVGNSTGGIIALCLTAQGNQGNAKFTAHDILKLYCDYSHKIFQKSFFRSLYTGFGMWAPRYNRLNLDNVLATFFGETRLSQVVCPVVVTSYNISEDSLNIWTSYQAKTNSYLNISMVDAAGATSAAPTYFAPKKITHPCGKTTVEIDGGVYANDPEAIAVTEALIQHQDLKPEQIFILSLGTGRLKLRHHTGLHNKGILGWMMEVNLIDLMLNADTELDKFTLNSYPLLYKHKIQIDLEPKNSAMDNVKPENLRSLLQISTDFIHRSQKEIEQICHFLSQSNTYYRNIYASSH